MAQQYDAITIGGGPAGAIAAFHLARLGWHVLLVDRRLPGRGKTCGHCLSSRALPMLHRAGLEHVVDEVSCGRMDSFRLHVDDDLTLTLSLDGGHDANCGVLVDRRCFDRTLIDEAARAGVEVIQPAGASIDAIDRHHATARVRQGEEGWCASSPLIIGADGLRSRVAQRAGFTRHEGVAHDKKFGMSFAFCSDRADCMQRGRIEMFLLRGAYLGVVNQGGGVLHVAYLAGRKARRGGGTQARRGDGLQRVACDFASRFSVLRRVGLGSLLRDQMQHRVGAAPMPWRTRCVANDRVALVGDAAGYVEPFTGEGMTWAIESADALAEVLADVSPGYWTAGEALRYRSLWKARIASHHRRCRIIARLIAHPAIVRIACRFMHLRPALSEPILQRLVPA